MKRQGYEITTTATYTNSDVTYTFTTKVNSKSAIEATEAYILKWLTAHNRRLISNEIKPI